MGDLFSTLGIGVSGLQAAQVQMAVAGQNIANVNTDGYSRQRATLQSRAPLTETYGQLGQGVNVQDVTRVHEDFLDTVFRQQSAGLGSAQTQASYYSQMENLFQEPSANGFSAQINSFFSALNDFSNNVEEEPVRTSVVTQAQSLSTGLNQVSQQIYSLQTDANQEVINMVPQINSITQQIAALNGNIRVIEGSGTKANDLRDQRDLLLDQLSQIVKISYREETNGQVDVTVGGDILVNGTDARTLEADRDTSLNPTRDDLVQVRFADTQKAVEIDGGQLYGALNIRDVALVDLNNKMNSIAQAFIQGVNSIQSNGKGLTPLSGAIESSNAVKDTSAPLAAAGLPYAVKPGSFDVTTYDSSGTATTHTITVTASTTLQSLTADLNAIPNFSASITGTNTLSLGASSPYTYSFGNDTSGALVALGVNGLFTGDSAANIAVNANIQNNPDWLTSSYGTDVLNTGDTSAALDLAALQNKLLLNNGSATINNYYENAIVQLGADSQANTQTQDVQQSFVNDFADQRQQVSGVSIDEETTNMLAYQRAYEASARVITSVNDMMTALLAMAPP